MTVLESGKSKKKKTPPYSSHNLCSKEQTKCEPDFATSSLRPGSFTQSQSKSWVGFCPVYSLIVTLAPLSAGGGWYTWWLGHQWWLSAVCNDNHLVLTNLSGSQRTCQWRQQIVAPGICENPNMLATFQTFKVDLTILRYAQEPSVRSTTSLCPFHFQQYRLICLTLSLLEEVN